MMVSTRKSPPGRSGRRLLPCDRYERVEQKQECKRFEI
jgi:hypothetical protein